MCTSIIRSPVLNRILVSYQIDQYSEKKFQLGRFKSSLKGLKSQGNILRIFFAYNCKITVLAT